MNMYTLNSYINDVQVAFCASQFQQRFNSTKQNGAAARLENETIAGDEHTALTETDATKCIMAISLTHQLKTKINIQR